MPEIYVRNTAFLLKTVQEGFGTLFFMDKGFKTSTRSIILKAKSEERYMNPAACCL